MKRTLALLLALVMLSGLMPMTVFAEEATEPEVNHGHDYEAVVTDPTCTAQGYTTYTCVCGEGYVDDYVDAAGHAYTNGVCAACGVKEWDTDGDGVLEILAIGNSFSVDALQYAYQIAQNLGIAKIAIGNLYIGGCTLATHAANAAGDLGKYTYYYNDNGAWTSTGSYKISAALESRSWDYVSMQQGSPVSGVESSYNQDLTNLIAYVQDRSGAKLVWHMTWAYQQNSTHSAFPTYNKDQMTMYNGIVSAVQNKIVTNSDIDLIVPNGTAVQNSRTSLLGDTTTRDGYHMSYVYGRYLTGLMFIKTVTGLSVDDIAYTPSGLEAAEKAIAIESVNNAAAKPFEVTQSVHVKEEPVIPDEGYILLKPELHKGAYWHCINADHYNTLVTDASNSKYFYATIRFTREMLPTGSIIILEDGWQYRPEGWITDTVQTGRADTTTESYVEVTEQWWGNYTLRGFNISKVGTPSLMNLDAADIHKAFRIYVPEEKHIHTWEDGECITCGEQQSVPITYAGSTLKYETQVKVVNLFKLSGVEARDAGVMVFTEDQYSAWDGKFNAAYARAGLKLDAETGCYCAESDPVYVSDLHTKRWYVGYAKLADGSYVFTDAELYGPTVYAYNMLAAGSTASDETKALCVALLNYSAAMQKYLKPATPDDQLANYGLTAEQKKMDWTDVKLNKADAVPDAMKGKRDTDVFTATGKNIFFDYNVRLTAVYKISDATVNTAKEAGTIFWTEEQFNKLTTTPTIDNYGEGTVRGLVRKSNGQWVSHSPTITAKDLAGMDLYYMGYVVKADGEVSYTTVMSYNMEQYIGAQAAKGTALGELCKALYHYERAAAALFSPA